MRKAKSFVLHRQRASSAVRFPVRLRQERGTAPFCEQSLVARLLALSRGGDSRARARADALRAREPKRRHCAEVFTSSVISRTENGAAMLGLCATNLATRRRDLQRKPARFTAPHHGIVMTVTSPNIARVDEWPVL